MVRTTGTEGGGSGGYTTSYVTNVISTMIVDLSKPVASKITSYLVTAYITPPPIITTDYVTGIISRITALVTNYYLEGNLYTSIRIPTNILLGTYYVTSPARRGGRKKRGPLPNIVSTRRGPGPKIYEKPTGVTIPTVKTRTTRRKTGGAAGRTPSRKTRYVSI